MAITEKYVTSGAAGGGDGSSGSPYTWAEAVAVIVAAGAGGSAGVRYNIKADAAYSRTTTTDTISGGGTVTSPLIIRGYTTTIGDGYSGRSAVGALTTTNMPDLTYTTGTLTISATFTIIESMDISGARNGANVTISGADSFMHWCRVANAAAGSSGIGLVLSAARSAAIDNDISISNGGNAGSSALNPTGTAIRLIGNRVTSTAVGININNAGSTRHVCLNNTVYGCTGVGIAAAATAADGLICGNTVVGGSGDGIDVVASTTGTWVIGNNMVTDNGGYGIDLNNANVGCFLFNNRTRDNTSGAINLGTDWVTATNFAAVTTDTGGASTDYVDSGANDYNLIAASPATSAGIPASASIGALQRSQVSAGGGASYATFGS